MSNSDFDFFRSLVLLFVLVIGPSMRIKIKQRKMLYDLASIHSLVLRPCSQIKYQSKDEFELPSGMHGNF